MIIQDFSATAIFCDSIRDEVGGTNTIVGTLLDNMTVPFVPGIVPRIAAYVRMSFNAEKAPMQLSVSLKFFENSVSFKDTVTQPALVEHRFEDDFIKSTFADSIEQGAVVATLVARIEASPFTVPAPGILTAVVALNGREQAVGSLRFVVAGTEVWR